MLSKNNKTKKISSKKFVDKKILQNVVANKGKFYEKLKLFSLLTKISLGMGMGMGML